MQNRLPLINGASMAQNEVRHAKVPEVSWRNGAPGAGGAPVAHIDARHDDFRHLQPVAQGNRRKKDTLALIAERDSLYRDLEVANAEVETAHAALAPYEGNWNAACQTLAGATDQRLSGVVIPYADLMAMYEARRIAGHLRHPYKTRAEDANRWRSNLMKRLKDINADIGV